MTRAPAVCCCFAAQTILDLAVIPAACAAAPQAAERPAHLVGGTYRVASIQAWQADGGRSMLNAADWERIEVREDGDKRDLVIHYRAGRTSAFALRPSGPSSPPMYWHVDEFAVSSSTTPDGSVRLRMHFCYRGFVHLTLQVKGASPDSTPAAAGA